MEFCYSAPACWWSIRVYPMTPKEYAEPNFRDWNNCCLELLLQQQQPKTDCCHCLAVSLSEPNRKFIVLLADTMTTDHIFMQKWSRVYGFFRCCCWISVVLTTQINRQAILIVSYAKIKVLWGRRFAVFFRNRSSVFFSIFKKSRNWFVMWQVSPHWF